MSTIKNILYISYDGMTDPLGQSQVIPYLQAITKMGYRFTILSVEKKKRFAENGPAISKLLKQSGIEWETMIFSSKLPIVSKLKDQLSLNTRAAHLYRQKKFDFIHCRSYVAAETGKRLYRRYSVPFLFDMRGFWVDERVDSGHWNLHNPVYRSIYKLYKKKEKEFLLHSAQIISLTEKGKEELMVTFKIPGEKITVIPCCTDLQLFNADHISTEDKLNAREKLGIDKDSFVLSYVGSLGGWYLTNEMLDFFAVLKKKKPGAKFLFISHNDPSEIKLKAKERGIDEADIIVQPAQRAEVPLFISLSNWSIFLIKDAYSKKASSPTKQGEIMAMGTPLICNDIGDTGSIIVNSNAGVLLKSFSDHGYQEAVDQMLSVVQAQPAKIRQAAAQYFDLDKGVQNYLEVYQRMVR